MSQRMADDHDKVEVTITTYRDLIPMVNLCVRLMEQAREARRVRPLAIQPQTHPIQEAQISSTTKRGRQGKDRK